MAANTTANCSSLPRTFACLAICAAKLCMGKTGCGEDRQLLAADQGVQSVNGRDTGLDKLLRIASGRRVHGQAVDISSSSGRISGPPSMGRPSPSNTRPSISPETPKLHGPSQEADLTVGKVDTGRVLKQLHQGIAAVDLQDLASASFRRWQALSLPARQMLHSSTPRTSIKRTGNFLYGSVFFWHFRGPPFWQSSAVSAASWQNRLIFCCQLIFFCIFITADLLTYRKLYDIIDICALFQRSRPAS